MSGSPDPQASEYLVGAYRPLQNLAARGVAIDSGQTQDKIGEGNKMPGKSVLVLAQFLAVLRSCGIEEDPIAPAQRSDGRRVGQEGVNTCRTRWAPSH